jgi:hypothetical protein
MLPLVRTHVKIGCGDVFFEVLDLRCAGNGEHDGRAMEEPRDRKLSRRGVVALGEFRQGLREGLIGLEELAGGDRIPRQEGDTLLFAPGEGLLVAAVGEGVAVLHADDGDDLLRLFDLDRCDFTEADVAYFSLVLHLAKCAEGLFERGAGVDAVELVELNALDFQAAQAHFDTLD